MLLIVICNFPVPKAELNTRNSTKCGGLVEFLVFNSIYWQKSDPPDAENRVVDGSSIGSGNGRIFIVAVAMVGRIIIGGCARHI